MRGQEGEEETVARTVAAKQDEGGKYESRKFVPARTLRPCQSQCSGRDSRVVAFELAYASLSAGTFT